MLDDPVFSHRFAELEIELKALEYTELRTLASLSVGKSPGPESSILKVVGTELAQRIDEMFVELAAYHSLPYLPEQFDEGFQGAPLEPGVPAGRAWSISTIASCRFSAAPTKSSAISSARPCSACSRPRFKEVRRWIFPIPKNSRC